MSSSSVLPKFVRVGVGCMIESVDYPGMVILGRRLGSHGAGQFALPGGHLEIGESFEECAIREAKEETNLDLENMKLFHVTNNRNMDNDPLKHYITIFMKGNVCKNSAPLTNMEPNKCEEWKWVKWSDIISLKNKDPGCLFDPIKYLIDEK
mmetsp:Transcript_33005/g.31447  ORF Transcript_33005/g.31447 Transcript_33005/m.31447 type:complete len:151 (-) Transcript_33005:132-584(-)|eukprot:CAMPEP_0119051592 /NCGR_PEP_ID=MMETSP1177-20130426/73157_1 /TAXON_ID=2985 /ORGANISM="Ochromonas sp, Strain CCMP1899" /LENGTH=150 /DNA_ID=CAMNT_0007030847 /DNA_START=32 /DNA_END=484 /DNA_ORIENTATION=+